MAKIYVSSTFLDLQEHRAQVGRVIRRMGHEDVAMEYYVAEDQRPVAKCLADVAACDVYIGIFAWRYGWQPKIDNLNGWSITEMEYHCAEASQKPCLIFLLDGKAPWPPDFTDDDKTKIRRLRNELSEKHETGPGFKSADELGELVAEAIHKLLPATVPLSEHNLTAYYTALRKRYGALALEGLTPPKREEFLQIQLRSVFVEQYVRENLPPVELPRDMWEKLYHANEIRREDLPPGLTLVEVQREHQAYYEKAARPVFEVLTNSHYQYIVILGDPGSGKSTLARYVTLSLVDSDGDEKLRGILDGYLPLLIELRRYAVLFDEHRCDTFLGFLEFLGKTEGWGLTASDVDSFLKNDGRAVTIFDGLDEIFDPDLRERITRQIVGFCSTYPKARVIATSRVIGYSRTILTEYGFVHFALQDLGKKQVETFINRWYGLALSDHPDEAQERRERILRSYAESRSIRELAANPMLLTIMAIIGKHQELPRERWRLYDHAASVLIEHWDVNKHLKNAHIVADLIGEDDKKQLLGRLAFKMQRGDGGLAGNYIQREQLQTEFESYLRERYAQTPDHAVKIARAMIAQFRERDFVLSRYGADLYGFVHRTFLEYFCAFAYVYRFEKTREWTIEKLKEGVYDVRFEDPSWREVVRLICGMLDEKWAGQIIEYLITKAGEVKEARDVQYNVLTLATECLGEVSNVGAIADSFERLLSSVFGLVNLFVANMDVRVEQQYGGIVFFVPSRERTDFLIKGALVPLGQIAMHLHKEGLILGKIQELAFLEKALCLESFRDFIGALALRAEPFRRKVFDLAEDGNIFIQANSLLVLSKYFNKEPEVFELLRECASHGKDVEVRHTAVIALGKYYQHDMAAFSLICSRVTGDSSPVVRACAVDELANWNKHPDTLSLWRQTKNDPVSWVRGHATYMLKKFFSEE